MKHILGNEINGVVVGGYVFDASARTITITGVTVTFEDILLVTNYTANKDIFLPGCSGKGGSFSGSVLTLDYPTEQPPAMSDTDVLQITVELDMLLALQSTQEAIEVLLQDIKANTADLDINTDEIEAKLDEIKGKLDTLNGTDFATEATQALVLAELQGINSEAGLILAELQTLNGVDFATSAKQDTQTTELQGINTELDTITARLDSLLALDFATETTLSGLKTSFDGTDFATEATLDALKTAFDSRDIASEAKQDEQTAELQSINARQSIFDSYQIADEDAVTSPAYYGLTQADGTWLVMRITGTTTKSYRYANASNNGAIADFPDAWTNRATLTYDYWYNLTGL